MKKKNLLFSIFLFFLFVQYTNAQTWVLQQEGMGNSAVYHFSFLNSTTGFASCADVGAGMIYKTTNAGNSWTYVLTTSTGAINDVRFINSLTGFTCSSRGEIARTLDGGASWSIEYTDNNNGTLNTMNMFPSGTTGFAAGFGYCARSGNSGNSWSKSTLTGTQFNNAVLSSTKAIICGTLSGSNGYIWTTTNSGSAWTATEIDPAKYLFDINFIDANTGFVCGRTGAIYKTTNGGTNWTSFSISANDLTSVYFLNANTGFVGANHSGMYRTTNGGTDFTGCTVTPGILNNSISDIYFFDANNGILSGSAGVYYKTSDGGLTWIMTGNNLRMNAIDFPNSSTGYVVGVNIVAQRTTDGGANWMLMSVPLGGSELYSVKFVNSSTGFIGGSGLVKTENGGINWTSLSPGISLVYSIDFTDENTGYFGGTSGSIAKTTNNGDNFTTLSTGLAGFINGISFPDANTGYVCSSGGNLRKTTDEGANWTALTSGTSQVLYSINFINVNTGFAVGAGGTIINTTNGGANWSLQTSGTTSQLNSVKCGSNTDCLVAGNSGLILITTNGGANWSTQTSGTPQHLRSISFATKDSIYIAGALGTIIKSTDQLLPVELASFTSTVNGNNVVLNWNTVSEENNSGFEIERNSFGAVWSKIGFIAGKGTVNTPQNYSYIDNGLNSGRYSYRLKQIDYNGNYKYYELQNEVVIGVPNKFALMQNYPNPFNPSTIINYQLAINSFVSLKIYDLAGKEVMNLVNENQTAGYYAVNFNASSLSSGTYFYKLTSDKFSDVKKMIVVK
jgi:photosystem II stability/assembly factor-like uncharacterized protein